MTTNTTPKPTVKHTAENVLDLAQKLLEGLAKDHSHTLALDALLSAYATLAANSPCCTSVCAKMAFHVAEKLLEVATKRPAGASLH